MQDLAFTIAYRALPVHAATHVATRMLREWGYPVRQVGDGPIDLDPREVLWILNNASWFPSILRRLDQTPARDRPLVVLWHVEPLPPPRAAGLPWPPLSLREVGKIALRRPGATDVYTNLLSLRRVMRKGLVDLLLVSTPGRREFLAEREIGAQWVPIGYDPSRGRDLGLARDIDALFIGSPHVPRTRRQVKRLRRRGVDVTALGSWTDPGTWGESRTRLINRAKIFLNLQRYAGELSGVRFILGMANGALVVSEPVYDPAPYLPGKHYVSATVEEMRDVIAYYLAHEEERRHVADEGHRFVTRDLTMERSLARILELIRERLRARGGAGALHDPGKPDRDVAGKA
jgi:hypothetical protein